MLKIELQQAEEKIHKASVLLEKLAGESGRWNTSLEEITTGLKNIPYQSMKASAFINYLAAKDEGVRVTKLALWDSRFGGVSTAESTGFSLVKYLSDESQILEYISAGLPSDQLSIENALISLTSDKSPLVIDPSYSLSQWLIAKCKQDKQVELVSSQEKKMVSVLELGIRFGKTVIVTEVDGVDSLFVNLLRKDLHKQGARLVVNVGDKIVDWNENFRLIFMSRNQSIKLEPNLAALVNTVNNLVTKKGLEEKLLSVIINDQKPGLESKKKDCLEQERGLKIEIGKLEKQLLEELASSSGNILENTALLNSLEETKSKSLAIAESLRESSRLKESLERERGAYRYLAERGTLVFLLLKDFNIVNHMYSFSLQEFMKVFQSNLKNSSAQTPKEFVQELTTLLLKGVLLRFGCGLQKKDKLAFALHLLSKQEGVFQENELEFLLDRVEGSEPKVSLPSWAAEECNQPFMKLSGVFPALVRGLKFEQPEWRSWAAEAECEKKFPSSMMLRPIQKVLLVKVFREDRLQDALEDFCCSALGISNLNEGVSNMASIYAAEPASDTPILFITSVGSDPSKEIEDFAVATVGKEKFFQISMGGGQNEAAMKSLESCASKGEWLCLKNLHLVPNFLPELEKTLNSLELNSGFKLFLTTEEHPKFPTVLLSCCYKFSYEAPPGIRMNAERVFTTIGSSMLKQMTNEEARITNILAIFHALLQERRTYIPQGWSKYYEFSLSDFKSGSQVLETVMMDRKQVDWPGLYGLFENAIYGGRIDRLVDLDVLRAYLETMFNEETLKTGKLGIGVTVPNSLDMKDHVKVLNQLPDINKPSYFGLPNVFQLSIKRNAVFNTSNLLKVLAKGKNADSSDDSNSAASKLKILKYYSKLIQIPEISTPIRDLSQDIIESVVQQEINHRIRLLHKINEYFAQLERVFEGQASLTSSLEKFAEALGKNTVPSVLSEIWDGTDYPDEWIRIFGRKTGLLKNWAVALTQDALYRNKLPLGVFLEPGILLNTLRQKTCRQLKKPLDELEILVTLGAAGDNESAFSFLVGDMHLEGGVVNSSGAVEAQTSKSAQERTAIESVTIGFVPKSSAALNFEGLELPIYLNADKEMMLMRVRVPYSGSKNEVLLAGCSFYV